MLKFLSISTWSTSEVENWFEENYPECKQFFKRASGRDLVRLSQEQFQAIVKDDTLGIFIFNAISDLKKQGRTFFFQSKLFDFSIFLEVLVSSNCKFNFCI